MIQVLKQCGDDLSRENIMRQAANLKDLELPMLLPGIKVNTSPDNYYPIRRMQLASFNGESWEQFGDVLSGWANRRFRPGTTAICAFETFAPTSRIDVKRTLRIASTQVTVWGVAAVRLKQVPFG